MAEDEWRVGDLVTLQRGTTYAGALVGEAGPALLGLGSIEPGGGFRATHFKTFGGACPKKIMVASGELFVALKGATKDGSMVGSIARVPSWLAAGGRLTQDTARLDFTDAGRGHESYLYWMLRTPQYRNYCAGRITGSASASFSRDDFLDYRFPVPSPSRIRVVETLGALDDKIELNRRLSETLQTTARALFKSWFVPEAGREPDGWRTRTIADLAEVVGGSTPSTAESRYWNGRHYWATPKDLAGLKTPVLLRTERMLTDAGLGQISSGVLPAGTVLMSSRAPIGYLAITEVPVAINQGFIAMKPRPGVSGLFLLHWAASSQDQILSRANGSTFLEISKSNFRPIEVLAPPADAMASFDRIVRPIHERIVANERQIAVLAEIRDALLPRLLRGEVWAPAGGVRAQ